MFWEKLMRSLAIALALVVAVTPGLATAHSAKTHKVAPKSHAKRLPTSHNITRTPWGDVGGQQADIFTLTNSHGMRVRITNYGARLVDLIVPSAKAKPANIVLGYDTAAAYGRGAPYGAVIGRFAGRIGGARFTLDGKTYRLKPNGGPDDFAHHLYSANMIDGPNPALVLSMVAADGEQGFPGNLTITVTYTLTTDNRLRIDYRATTDRPTVLNPTSHTCFNLKGAGHGDVLRHSLQLFADAMTPTDANHIATGEVMNLSGTGFDFTKPKRLGKDINGPDPAILAARGYDINAILRGPMGKLRPAAKLTEPETGRMLEVWTTQPGIQLHVLNDDKPLPGRTGEIYGKYSAVCLEPQHFPNSPNIAAFPTTTLKPGPVFYQSTELRFGTFK